ncbi:MAG: hypothetical protein AAGF15_06325 [Pseudomonadota bacterium]
MADNPNPKDQRKARLAEALRANLRRRKTQKTGGDRSTEGVDSSESTTPKSEQN